VRLLLIEDDPLIGSAVRDSVKAEGHAVDWARSLGEAEALRAVVTYDLVLLDLMLPDGPGLRFLAQVRTSGDPLPVVILTARDQVSDRIAGLKAGADDYLVKPFDLDELSARIGAVARRAAGTPNPALRLGALSIDLADHRVERDGKVLSLTAREWAVLETLLQRPQAIIPKGQIEERLYALGAEVESNTIEVYVARLRKKLGADLIATERGLGYRLGMIPGTSP